MNILNTKEININSYRHLVTDVLDVDTMDWTVAINTAISEMNAGDTLEIPSNQRYGTTSSIVVDKSIKISGGATLVCYHNETGIIFLPSSGNLSYLDIDIGVLKNEINWDDTSVGIHVKNSYYGIFRFPKVHNFTTGIILEGRPQSNGSAGAFTYNTVYIGRMGDYKTGILLRSRNGEGWCTENTFYGGSLGSGYGIGSEGIHLVFDSDEKGWNNNNKFFGVSFEGHYQRLLQGVNTADNVFYACRYEMPKMIKSVDWGVGAQSNVMQNGYGLTEVIEKMTDNGRYNNIEYINYLDGKVSYYDGDLFKYSNGTPNRLRGNNTHEVILVGKKGSVNTSSNSEGLVTLDLSKGSEFFINAENGINKIDIVNKPTHPSGLEIALHVSQGSLGSDITKLMGLLGDKELPVKRAYGLDLYTFKYFGEIGTYLFCMSHFAR